MTSYLGGPHRSAARREGKRVFIDYSGMFDFDIKCGTILLSLTFGSLHSSGGY